MYASSCSSPELSKSEWLIDVLEVSERNGIGMSRILNTFKKPIEDTLQSDYYKVASAVGALN